MGLVKQACLCPCACVRARSRARAHKRHLPYRLNQTVLLVTMLLGFKIPPLRPKATFYATRGHEKFNTWNCYSPSTLIVPHLGSSQLSDMRAEVGIAETRKQGRPIGVSKFSVLNKLDNIYLRDCRNLAESQPNGMRPRCQFDCNTGWWPSHKWMTIDGNRR